MVSDLDKMMIARLDLFKQKNRILPHRVLVYRDGVSEVGDMSLKFSLIY